MGWKVGIFERWGEVYPLPRAVCIDHEIYRMMHAAGLGPLVDKVTRPAPPYRWYSANWQELLCLDWPKGSVSGGAEVNFVHQPSFERELDGEIKRRSNIFLHFEHECTGISQDDYRATAEVLDTVSGESRSVTAKYILGIDGANSFVRESLGISRTDLGFEADWLVVDYILSEGLSAKDLGLIECGQYCNPKRPTTIVPGGAENGRELRRWEFMRLPHETQEEMVQQAKVQQLLGDWIKPEQGELVRHALYTFRSLITDKWRVNRIILAGDAAHLMPPFMGQGMCAGLRDVWNLSWKLDKVLRGDASETLLDSYELERKPHVTEVVKLSMFLGSIICMPDEQDAANRDALFLSDTPPQMAPFPHLVDGLLAFDIQGNLMHCAGLLSPHGTVRHQRRTQRLDSFVPAQQFTLMLRNGLSTSVLSEQSLQMIHQLSVNIVQVEEKSTACDDAFADTQGQLLSFMEHHGVNALLVRPDHYIYGGAQASADLNHLICHCFEALEQRLPATVAVA
jgi:3-(3-hydroxy-phenyl)propionate hydroxylase/flavoprotein hydroxylase